MGGVWSKLEDGKIELRSDLPYRRHRNLLYRRTSETFYRQLHEHVDEYETTNEMILDKSRIALTPYMI